MITSYKGLVVWQKSFELVKLIYKLSDQFPKAEQYGLCSQIRRCSVSIPSNIAEGQQRNSLKEYRQFIGIAEGSATELETQMLLARDIYALDTSQALFLLYEVQKMLKVLNQKLEPRT